MEKLTYAEAVARLPEGDEIHTYRQAGPTLIGADWERREVLALIQTHGAVETGPAAQATHHGLAVIEADGRVLFIQTSEAKPSEADIPKKE